MSKYTDKELLGRVKGWLDFASSDTCDEWGDPSTIDAGDLNDGKLDGYVLRIIIDDHLGGNAQERMTFGCPNCGDSYIEVVNGDAIITEQLLDFESEGEFEITGEYELHDAGTQRFQCIHCGHIIAESAEDMEAWYKENK